MGSAIKKFSAAIALAGAALAGQANAAAIDFYGAEFDLYLGAGSGATWDVIYTADFTNFDALHDGKDSQYMTHINWKWSGFDVNSVNSVTGPNGIAYGDNVNSNGCSGGFPDGWVCYDLTPDVMTNGSYSWTFNVTFDDTLGAGDMDATGNPLRARLADSSGEFDDLMSCKAGTEGDRCTTGRTEVPVPGTLGLLGLGLAGLGLVRRRSAA